MILWRREREAGIQAFSLLPTNLLPEKEHVVHFNGEGNVADLGNAQSTSEIRDHLSSIADANCYMPTEDQSTTRSTTVHVPGFGDVHKSTLISKLNSFPGGSLTWDRLSRVKYGKHQPGSNDRESPDQVGLFDDVAIYIKDKGMAPRWQVGRVQRIRNKGKGTIEYRKPVSLKDPKHSKVVVSLVKYQQDGDSYLYPRDTPLVEYLLENVIMQVHLEGDSDGRFHLDASDHIQLQEFLSHTEGKQFSSRSKSLRRSQTRHQAEAVQGEGEVLLEIQPVEDNSGRPKRKRWLKTYEFY